MPALNEALRGAGFQTTHDRLLAIAEAALALHPRTLDLARTYVLEAVKDEPALLFAMFANWHGQAADALLQEIITRRKAKPKPVEIGASVDASTRGCQPRSGGGPQSSAAIPSPEQRDAASVVVARVISKLDTFKINGRPIGDCTPEEAMEWRASRLRDTRFVWMLCSGLPPGQRIRDSIRPDEAEAMYQRAQEAQGNE